MNVEVTHHLGYKSGEDSWGQASVKHERRFTDFDDEIVAMYARGMREREIQRFVAESYGT